MTSRTPIVRARRAALIACSLIVTIVPLAAALGGVAVGLFMGRSARGSGLDPAQLVGLIRDVLSWRPHASPLSPNRNT